MLAAFAVICGTALCTPLVAYGQQDEGEKLFKGVCVACHTVNQGKLIGPDLADVHKRRPMEWILKFVKSSQSVIKSGDPYATALFEEHNNMIMPDNNYTDAQIMSIINYIAANSPGGPSGGVAVQSNTPPRPVTEEDIAAGESLFVGKTRLTNAGPACNSCHNVRQDRVIAGGALAVDLTDAHSRLSAAGVNAILNSPPFPAMKQAFEGKPLTDDEQFRLTAFLGRVDRERASQSARYYGAKMFLSGLGLAVLLVGLLGGAWVRVKKKSVNHDIYARQVQSVWEPMSYSEQDRKA